MAGGHLHLRGHDAKDGLGDGRFAGATFADKTVHLAHGDIERDVAQDRPAVAQRRRAQSINGEASRAHRRNTGSRLRASPSPSWLNATTVANKATNGAASTHQA